MTLSCKVSHGVIKVEFLDKRRDRRALKHLVRSNFKCSSLCPHWAILDFDFKARPFIDAVELSTDLSSSFTFLSLYLFYLFLPNLLSLSLTPLIFLLDYHIQYQLSFSLTLFIHCMILVSLSVSSTRQALITPIF
jgi:hypothetical protein